MRKTFSVAALLHHVNRANETSTVDPAVRQGWNSLLETVLHRADAYYGFGYLEARHLSGSAVGSPPGVEFRLLGGDRPGEIVSAKEFHYTLWDQNTERRSRGEEAVHTPEGMTREFPDESRRCYLVATKLCKEYNEIERQDIGK